MTIGTSDARVRRLQGWTRDAGVDGWLLYDFRGTNPLAMQALALDPGGHRSRRWFYWIPADGDPVGIVHRIEAGSLGPLPGARRPYSEYTELVAAVHDVLRGARRIAMEYAPEGRNPYVSTVDAGTIELVRGAGVEVLSSADLVQQAVAVWPEHAYPLYRQAAEALITIKSQAWDEVSSAFRDGRTITEQDVARFVMSRMDAAGLVVDTPIVGVGAHAANPHYDTLAAPDTPIVPGTCLLIDLFAKVDAPDAPVADFTYMAWTGPEPSETFREIWSVARDARDAALVRIRSAVAAGADLEGWEVDDAARHVIDEAGYGEHFVHRTGHSLGTEAHGPGVNADGYEIRDERRLIPGIALTVEPGIYLDSIGVRTEVNVHVHAGRVEVFETPPQREPAIITAEGIR